MDRLSTDRSQYNNQDSPSTFLALSDAPGAGSNTTFTYDYRNRMNSTDSRFCFSTCSDTDATPFLPMQNMVGKVMGVFWPLEVSRTIEAPNYAPK